MNTLFLDAILVFLIVYCIEHTGDPAFSNWRSALWMACAIFLIVILVLMILGKG